MRLFKPNVQKMLEKKDVRGLIKALGGSDDDVRQTASEALVEIGAPAVDLLIDRLLQQAWGDHPRYFRIDNERRDWPAKSKEALRALSSLLSF